MVWILIALSALLVLGIAVVAIGQETSNLADTPTRAFFNVEEAVHWVADHLPTEVAARTTYEELELLMLWQITYLRERGVATFGGIDHAAQLAAQEGVVTVSDEDELVDELIWRAANDPVAKEMEIEMSLEPVDAVVIVDLTADYLVQIGAVGEAVEATEVRAITAAQDLAELEAETAAWERDQLADTLDEEE